ncbi:HAD hydrolase family protein [Piscinibacter sp. XHJ-5]|uniref:HAD family hydrolase n=1 Tax=Piscinibacter sp. XHJ-5 TaxID=3037797 RepID=UPI0024528E06|nr:HAD hydrolase family protein [Piscinibacter sp. XHJ-5]
MSHPSASDPGAVQAEVRDFLRRSHYMERGAVFTDLDGTAVHERDGRACIPPDVEDGLKRVHDSGRRVVINTLRFPRSVISAFAQEWFRITGEAIPLVALKGSLLGHIAPAADGTLGFEELEAAVLDPAEVDELMLGVEGLVKQGADDLLVFFYPRDWRRGELLWTPDTRRLDAARAKYVSASEVFGGPVDVLHARLSAADVCLVFLLDEAPEDRRMAYQHTERTRFVTHVGVDKRYGTERMARHLGIDLEHSVGAGDAQTDTFLSAVGLAAIVGNAELDFKGIRATLRLADPLAWGRVLVQLGSATG